jgi:predicted DNA-binding transcriptional regulator YafY
VNHGKSAVARYRVIDIMLRNTMRRYPTMEDLINGCEIKLSIRPSAETIQKDIANMRLPFPDGYDAPIRYNRYHKGYEYTDPNYTLAGVTLRPEELEAVSEALEIIRSIGGSRISNKFSHAAEKLLSASLENTDEQEDKLPVLQTMNPPVSQGFEHFDLLYKACRERVVVSFIHFSYEKRTFKHILLHPFLIKEFENRWYIIGFSEQHQAVRTFGLDRVNNPVLVNIKYKRTGAELVRSFLHDVHGVFPIAGAVKEKVVLHTSKLLTHYFKAYPLHESQVIKKKSEGSSFIILDLIPSVELARFILSHGKDIIIARPRWFARFIHKMKTHY